MARGKSKRPLSREDLNDEQWAAFSKMCQFIYNVKRRAWLKKLTEK